MFFDPYNEFQLGGLKAENLSDFVKRYIIVENELELYEKELEKLVQKEDTLPQLQRTCQNLEAQKCLKELDEKLEIFYSKAKENQASFQITAHLDNYEGPELNSSLANGEIIAFQAEVPKYGSLEKPEIGYLIWQLYDDLDNPIEGVKKVRQINENGEKELARFRFQINNLPNGKYTVALLHQLEGSDDITTAIRQFSIREPISINRLVVSNNNQGSEHQPVLSSQDVPHTFVYYTLGEEVPEAKITLQIIDQSTGKVIANQEVIRDRKLMEKNSV